MKIEIAKLQSAACHDPNAPEHAVRVAHYQDLIRAGLPLAPITVRGCTVIDGHHRWEAARLEGLTEIEAICP